MKISLSQLRRIIKEEVHQVTQEARKGGMKAPTLAKAVNVYNKMASEYDTDSVYSEDFAEALGVANLSDIEGFDEEFTIYADDSVRSKAHAAAVGNVDPVDLAEFINIDWFDVGPACRNAVKNLANAMRSGAPDEQLKSLSQNLAKFPGYDGQPLDANFVFTAVKRYMKGM